MIKKTLYFGNPCYLKKKDNQLGIDYPKINDRHPTVPIEDVGIVVLDHPQITITQALLTALLENNAAILSCNQQHLPIALMLPLSGHHAFTEKIRVQIEASLPLKKQLWQQTVIAKIKNQAALLKIRGHDPKRLQYLTKQVKSGDSENAEARAASYYWRTLFDDTDTFKRERFGEPPNNMLNYGYAILRSMVARSLTISGLLNSIGIHHRNKYNAYCLADDIMEPYRPYVDKLVMEMAWKYEDLDELTKAMKAELLSIPVIDVFLDKQKSPMMNAIQRTTASLMKCFEGTNKKILYPDLAGNHETN